MDYTDTINHVHNPILLEVEHWTTANRTRSNIPSPLINVFRLHNNVLRYRSGQLGSRNSTPLQRDLWKLLSEYWNEHWLFYLYKPLYLTQFSWVLCKMDLLDWVDWRYETSVDFSRFHRYLAICPSVNHHLYCNVCPRIRSRSFKTPDWSKRSKEKQKEIKSRQWWWCSKQRRRVWRSRGDWGWLQHDSYHPLRHLEK